jgi:AraC-like DNA-binding protein
VSDALRYVERPPGPELRTHVECLWEVSDRRPRAARPVERVVPDGCPELIVHLEDCFSRKVGGRWRVQPRVFLAGTLTRPWLLKAGHRLRTLGMRFRPGAPRAFLPCDMKEAADREVPLSAFTGSSASRALLDELRMARTQARRFALAESWLVRRLRKGAPQATSAGPAIALILKKRGMATIDEIAGVLGWSRRRLERAVRRDLGIRPKMFARIVRLNAVLATLDHGERARAVDVALDAGYFDQAHLLRDFRELVGRAFRASREADGEMARHFTHPRRLQALFEGE